MDPQPPPPPDPLPDPNAQLATHAATGCLAGLGIVGIGLLAALAVLSAIVLLGAFLIISTCSGR